jgi:hypothetical protein
VLFGIAVVTYLIMLVVAYFMYGRSLFGRKSAAPAAQPVRGSRVERAGADAADGTASRDGASSRISRGSASATKVAFGEDDEDEALFDSSSSEHTDDSAPSRSCRSSPSSS